MTNSFCIMGVYVSYNSKILYEQGFNCPYELAGDGFVVYRHPQDENFYFGIPLSSMNEDQTLKEFRLDVIERLSIEFPFLNIDYDDDVKMICEGWSIC